VTTNFDDYTVSRRGRPQGYCSCSIGIDQIVEIAPPKDVAMCHPEPFGGLQ